MLSRALQGYESVHGDDRRTHQRRTGRLVVDILLALLVAPVFLYFALRRIAHTDGVTEVHDDEIAIVVDALSGSRRVITAPGYQVYVPWSQEVYRLDKSPNPFVMEGNLNPDVNHVPLLRVRARDGSTFWFDSLTIQYVLMPDAAARVLDDSGPDEGFKEKLLRAYARSILRDEFGRFSPEDAVRPEILQAATRAGLERLNRALKPHGIEVLEISTPKPAFDKAYEDLIARRKLGDQQVERLKQRLVEMESERTAREAAIRKDKELETRRLEGNLVKDLGAAERENIRMKQDADILFHDKSEAGRAAKIEMQTRAAMLTARYTAMAQDKKDEILVLEQWGETAVRAALVKKLLGIEFNLVPYSRDPSPQRVEYENAQASALIKR